MSWTKEELEKRVREQAADVMISVGRRREYIKQLNKTINELTELRNSIQDTVDKYHIEGKYNEG